MHTKNALTLAVTTLAGLCAPTLNAKPQHDRVDVLEARVHELEAKLEKALNALDAATVKQTTAPAAPTPPAQAASNVQQQEIKALNTKVKLLERKFEVEKETADNERKSAPKVEAGQNGFKFGTADGDWQLRLRGFLQADTNTFMNDDPAPGTGIGWNNATGEPNPVYGGSTLGSDKFLIRRARLQFAGTLGKYTDFLIAPDFGQGQVRLFDAWADFHYWQPFSFAAGKMKGPQDLERLQTATNLLFNERAYPTQLAANRQIGAMFHGEIGGPGFETKYVSNISHTQELFSYQVGVFNPSADNLQVQNADTVNFSDQEFAGRVFAHPFRHVDFEPIQRLGIGFAGTYADWNQGAGNLQTIPSLQSQGQQNIVNYSTGITVPGLGYGNTQTTFGTITGNGSGTGNPKIVDIASTTTTYSGAFLNGSQYHIAPQGYWYWGPIGLLADWTASTQGLAVNKTSTTVTTSQADVNPTGTPGSTVPGSRTIVTTTHGTNPVQSAQKSVTNTAWQVAASYVLTGEDNTFWQIKPRQSFNPFEGSWGAWQLAARYTALNIDNGTFTNFGTTANPLYLFSDPRSSISRAQTWGVGANWFWNSNVKIQANYEQTQFTGGAVTANNTVANRPDEKVFFTRVQFWW